MNTTPITLRDARIDETDDIAAVIQAAYAEYSNAYSPESWQRYFAMLGEVRSHFGKADVIVAEVGGSIAGCVMFYPDGSTSGQGEWPVGWAGMLRLAVHPGHRGNGIGRALTQECVRRGRAAGKTTLALHTTDWMAIARAMYERMGFERDETFDFVTRGGTHAMGYRLTVAGD